MSALIRLTERLRLQNDHFVIVSNNCWGYPVYKLLGREYNTPFVGLFLHPECYLCLLYRFEYFLSMPLQFVSTSKHDGLTRDYPIGHLGEVEIHFMHYRTEADAETKWGRLVERLIQAKQDGVPLFIKFCSLIPCSPVDLERFHALPFGHKLSIGTECFENNNHACVPELLDPKTGKLLNGLKLYKQRYRYMDFVHWLKTGKVQKTFYSRVMALFSHTVR